MIIVYPHYSKNTCLISFVIGERRAEFSSIYFGTVTQFISTVSALVPLRICRTPNPLPLSFVRYEDHGQVNHEVFSSLDKIEGIVWIMRLEDTNFDYISIGFR